MGVYISLIDDRTGREVPSIQWPFGLAGDRELARFIMQHPVHRLHGKPDNPLRPINLPEFKEAIREYQHPHNPTRPTELVGLLELNPNYWIEISW